MKSENDTFRVLKRIPFNEAAQKLEEHYELFESIYDRYSEKYSTELFHFLDEYAKTLDWSAEDFCYMIRVSSWHVCVRWNKKALNVLY